MKLRKYSQDDAEKKSKISDVSLPMMYTYAFMTLSNYINLCFIFLFSIYTRYGNWSIKRCSSSNIKRSMGIVDIKHIFAVWL